MNTLFICCLDRSGSNDPEFAEVNGHWNGEAGVITRAINGRLLNRPAFNAFVKAMKASTEDSLLSREGRIEALATVTNAYPDWSRSVGLGRLTEYPWREISEWRTPSTCRSGGPM